MFQKKKEYIVINANRPQYLQKYKQVADLIE